jgi:hypothetical protein
MDKKLIQEVNRIREVMFGSKNLIMEQVKGLAAFYDILHNLMRTASKSSIISKKYPGLGDELKVAMNQVDEMVAAQPSNKRSINDFDTMKKAILIYTNNDLLTKGIGEYLKVFYKPTLTKSDAGYETMNFVKALKNDAKLKGAVHPEFLDEITDVIKNLESGTVRKVVKTQTYNRLKTALKLQSEADLAKAIDDLPPFWNAVRFSIENKLNRLGKELKTGAWHTFVAGGFKGFLYRLGAIAIIYYIINTLKDEIDDTESLLTDKGEYWNSLPPEIKQLFTLPEAEAKEKAQSLFDELKKKNPDEGDIENILSLDGKGSKLIVNQIAYYFEQIDEKNQVFGNRDLMDIMDERMSMGMDKGLSGLQDYLGIDGLNFTASDVVKTLDNLPDVEASYLKLNTVLKEIAEEGMEEIGQLSSYRVTYPLAINNGDYGVYSKFGKIMTPKQTIVLGDKLEQKGIDYYSSYNAFYDGLKGLAVNDFSEDDGFIILNGSLDDSNEFVPRDEDKVTSDMEEDNDSSVSGQYEKLSSNLSQTYDRLINNTIGGSNQE